MAHSSWGPGWPNCQPQLIDSSVIIDGTCFPGGIRDELVELCTLLVRETKARGYRFGTSSDPSYGCWGYGCRAISGTNSPSNHSWGLALDINAPSNPYTSPLTTDMPGWMPDLWNGYGFRWGGDYDGDMDAMHYEFMESVAAAADYTTQARADGIGGGSATPYPPIPDEGDEVMQLITAADSNGALFAYSPGRFIHVNSPRHLEVGQDVGLFVGDILVTDLGTLDILRDNCCGNGEGKGDNLVSTLPSSVATV